MLRDRYLSLGDILRQQLLRFCKRTVKQSDVQIFFACAIFYLIYCFFFTSLICFLYFLHFKFFPYIFAAVGFNDFATICGIFT